MAAVMEQRNLYRGIPARAWIRLCFKAPDGTEQELDLLADTGNPFAVILSKAHMDQLMHTDGPDANTNFGTLAGGWLRLAMPDFALTEDVLAYASDAVVLAAKASHPNFEGLVGLPLLQMLAYGGDDSSFWIRPLTATA